MTQDNKKRIEAIDALRGLCAVLMVIHHLLYNVWQFLGGPSWLFTNPLFDILHYIFAGLFIFLSGVSSRFSRGNIRRGVIALCLAAGISAVTYYIGMPVWFGVLHLLAFSMLFFGLTAKCWDKIPRRAAPVLFVFLVVLASVARTHVGLSSDNQILRVCLSVLGWPQRGFISYDYFPILPWLVVFLLGTWAGLYVVERKLPPKFYEATFPFFPAIGKRALLIYILHQPILYGLVMGIRNLMGIQ